MLYDGIELIEGEIINLKLENLTSDPTGTSGELYFKSDTNEVKFNNGSSWESLITSATVPSSSAELIRFSYTTAFNVDGIFPSDSAGFKIPVNNLDIDENGGASLLSGVMTLPAGTYDVEVATVMVGTSTGERTVATKLKDTTNNANLTVGISGRVDEHDSFISIIKDKITLAGTTNIELQSFGANTNLKIGDAHNTSGQDNIYSIVLFKKVA